MTATDLLQAWLALEHEAVWLYPVIGARRADLVDRATTSFEAHRDTRDALQARLRSAGVEPVPGKLSYNVGTVTTSGEAMAAAQTVEADISAVCLALTGVVEGEARRYAIRHLTRAALAEITWGATPRPFPGLR